MARREANSAPPQPGLGRQGVKGGRGRRRCMDSRQPDGPLFNTPPELP
ncbi:hypothetical protein HMPREF9946_05121 [Acetobacteraceae bacterium AT-5844]|nr:hypothetical protein HMPREF9946_05121 [Acetobacteraceae bacterium AT-5844]